MATSYPVLRWQIGEVRISRVVEIESPSPGTFFFAEATPEALRAHHKAEIEKWWPVIRQAGIKVE